MNTLNTTDLFKYIGKKLKLYRKQKNINTHEFSELLGITEGAYKNIESGTPVSFPLLLQITNQLDIPFESVIYDYTIHSPKKTIDPQVLNLFIETYNNCNDQKKNILLEILNAFLNQK